MNISISGNWKQGSVVGLPKGDEALQGSPGSALGKAMG